VRSLHLTAFFALGGSHCVGRKGLVDKTIEDLDIITDRALKVRSFQYSNLDGRNFRSRK